VQLEAELQQAKEAAAQADTALSMARALQCEVQFWRCRSTLQRTHGNSTQRVSCSWLQHRLAFKNNS
jgi:hypothetical protein